MVKSKGKRVTISQIAIKASTSAATVSYVLNGKGVVGAKMKAKVLAAASSLGYQLRHRAARKSSQQTGLKNLTLIWVNTSPHWRESYLSNLLNHTISSSLRATGGQLRTIFYNEADSNEVKLTTGEEDALLVAGRPGEHFCKKLPSRLPRLNIICQTYPTNTSFLDIDHVSMTREQVRYLIRHGHRKIGFVSNDRNHPYFEQRYLGYLLEMEAAHISPHPEWIVRMEEAPSIEIETSEPIRTLNSHLKTLLKAIGTPCALIAANDWIAGAIYQHVHRSGLRIPEDISVIGCDNDPNICNLLHPGLTTSTMPYEELGLEAVHWMRSVFSGRPPHNQPGLMLLSGKFIERGSCSIIAKK